MSQMLLLDKRTQSLIEDYVPQGDILEGVVCFFSVFADYTRVKILSALAISELCVTDLSRILDLNQTTVSHQLRFLKSAGIVKCCARQSDFYSLTNELRHRRPSQGNRVFGLLIENISARNP